MEETKEYTEKIFEEIKHIDEKGNEYWEARELMPLLGYSKWEDFLMQLIMQRNPVKIVVIMLRNILQIGRIVKLKGAEKKCVRL